MSGLTHDWDFRELLVPQILRGAGLMLAMIPVNNIALGTLSPDKMKGGSGLYNLTRNLGGAVGLAIINTLLNDRSTLHYERLSESIRWGRRVVEDRMASMATRFAAQGLDGSATSLAQMSKIVRREAQILSFSDVFLFLTVLFSGLVVLSMFIEKPSTGVKVEAH